METGSHSSSIADFNFSTNVLNENKTCRGNFRRGEGERRKAPEVPEVQELTENGQPIPGWIKKRLEERWRESPTVTRWTQIVRSSGW